MRDLSLHVLDIAENSIRAGATFIEIWIDENTKKNILTIKIKDNGRGMNRKKLNKVLDPFYTTKKGKRIGLGLALLAQSAQEANGGCKVESRAGKGTNVAANFELGHIDRKPLGDMAATMMALIGAHGDKIDFIYTHQFNDRSFEIGTREVKSRLDGVSIQNPEVLAFLRKNITHGLKGLGARKT